MKKNIKKICLLMLLALLMAGCTKKEAVVEEEKKQEETVEAVEKEESAEVEAEQEEPETKPEADVIMPLPTSIDLNNLNDCTVAVSFEKGNISADQLQMQVTVWAYDLYDMVDISSLTEGSVIQIGDEEVQVDAVESTDKDVLINGGLDQGGYELRTDEDTVYYQIGYSDELSYQAIGEVTLPVSDGFVFIDSSDLDKGEVSYTIEELQNNSEIFDHFVPGNTKIVIEDGKISVMERVYTP